MRHIPLFWRVSFAVRHIEKSSNSHDLLTVKLAYSNVRYRTFILYVACDGFTWLHVDHTLFDELLDIKWFVLHPVFNSIVTSQNAIGSKFFGDTESC